MILAFDMDFVLDINDDFMELKDPNVIPGVVQYEKGVHVYHKQDKSEKRNYGQIKNDRYIVRADLKDHEQSFKRKGLEIISKGQLCVLVLCGGQATRLGADRPKGTFDLGLEGPNQTLLQLQALQIVRLKALAKKLYPSSTPRIMWYVMVSKSTRSLIVQHLGEIRKKLDMDWDDIVVFEQKEIPALSFDGLPFKQEDGNIFLAPNGNGGIYDSLKEHIIDMHFAGVKYVHAYCVDNILCRVGDPVFLGAVATQLADCAAKVVEKKEPSEKVGVICTEKGRHTVVEYSELPQELATQRTEDGKLKFRAGSIANHIFTLDFLKKVCEVPLPYHIARKKVPYYDEEKKQQVTPTEPNGVKLERFIFDVFQASESFMVYQVERSDEFSPLKNADSVGVDCPSTCREDLKTLYRKWLQKAGIDEAEYTGFEYLTPYLTYEGEDLTLERFQQAKQEIKASSE
ncbi:unnamed protein product [Bursaphelenchus okinawaensis]|uniref:UDP-N-acetylglucosamine diphosphorylase n=1 Tax=Bursaphelenchus okinawaensis TaxID=465554 RepID=A0A811KT14_9BILA|nr:unnamed protein product [Bursaphelenchus okinawaensis]CAG9110363.1 unnamed protein product [Bursaphelenchus okinawaensis]